MMSKRGSGVPSLGGLALMKMADGGMVQHPSMTYLNARDSMHGMPRMALPDYMLARMAGGGGVDALIEQIRRRHGRLGASRGLDISSTPVRSMLEHDPNSWWDSGVPSRAALFRALNARNSLEMDPRSANELTQRAIDSVHGTPWRDAIESTLGGSPSDVLSWSMRRPLMGAAGAMYAGEAGAPETRPRPYESHGRWQPFERYE